MLTVKIKTGNDTGNEAFANLIRSECVRILREFAHKVDNGEREGVATDVNGNNVGTFKLTNR